MDNKLKILVVAHKPYEFPRDENYYPIQVGSVYHLEKFTHFNDNNGDNISVKNSSFCELTALYWAWKNKFFQNSEYIGLVHYRRYFKGDNLSIKQKRIASSSEILSYLHNYDCLVAKKRNYYIETVYSHYKNAHYIQDLDKVKEIISAKYPEYLTAYKDVIEGRTLHLYNMFVMKRELLEMYCEWLFDILFLLENEIQIDSYDQYQKRVFGFIAERLFNVWLYHHKINKKELEVINLENENIIFKAVNLLKRKFFRHRVLK